MPYSVSTDAKHWRDRAQEARAIAEFFSDPGARQTMLQIADSYEEMAKRAEHVKPSQPSGSVENPP